MTRLVAFFVVAAALSGCASYSPFSSAPASNIAPAGSPYSQPNLPRSQFECVTDEGYGRSHPCGNQS